MTIGFVVLLLERAACELLETKGAVEVLRVEAFAHGGHTASVDRLHAAVTQAATSQVVVLLAVGQTKVLVETRRVEFEIALLDEQNQLKLYNTCLLTIDALDLLRKRNKLDASNRPRRL